jgi:methionyl-tRNA formyltransferase
MIQKKMEEKPDGGFKTPDGRVSYAEAIEALEKHIGWLYPSLNSDNFIVKVNCPNCTWYIEEKVVDGYQKRTVKKCKATGLSGEILSEKFYCGKNLAKSVKELTSSNALQDDQQGT